MTKVLSVYRRGYFRVWIEFHELTGHQAESSSFRASETAPSLGSALSRLLFKEGTALVPRTFQLSPELVMAKSQGLQLPQNSSVLLTTISSFSLILLAALEVGHMSLFTKRNQGVKQ